MTSHSLLQKVNTMYPTKITIHHPKKECAVTLDVTFKDWDDFVLTRHMGVLITITPTLELVNLTVSFFGHLPTKNTDGIDHINHTPAQRLERFVEKTLQAETYFGKPIPMDYYASIYCMVNMVPIEKLPPLDRLWDALREARQKL